MVTKKWSVFLLSVIPNDGGLSDVVSVVSWLYAVSDGTHTYNSTGNTQIGPPNKTNFTQYLDITEVQALQWVFETLGQDQIASIETGAEKELNGLINPSVIYPALPWVKKAP
jgi:hypothetical protein